MARILFLPLSWLLTTTRTFWRYLADLRLSFSGSRWPVGHSGTHVLYLPSRGSAVALCIPSASELHPDVLTVDP